MEISVGGIKCRLEFIIAIAIVLFLIFGHTCMSCSSDVSGAMSTSLGYAKVEGFAGASSNNGQSAPYSLDHNVPVNTDSWFTPNLVVTPGQPVSAGVANILNREPQQIPLPEGQLSMFANTPFKPECCPNAYSNGSGCACMTTNQYNYLISRGGNNVPYSEY
jgi:hypothetical protein